MENIIIIINLGQLVYTYKRAVCVCWFVCLSSFYRPHDICPRCGAASEWPREQEPSSRAAPRAARASMHSESTRACRTTSQRKNRCADAFQKQNCTRARILSYVTAEIFKKKGNKKTNMPLPKFSLQFAFSWSVYFWNRTESFSSQIKFACPHGITENQATYLHCGGEARAKKRAIPPATCRKASTGKTGADTGPEGCGSPAVFPSPCLGDRGRDGGPEGCGSPAVFPSPCLGDRGRDGGKEGCGAPAVFPSPCLGDGGRDGGKEGCGAPAVFPSPCSRDTGRNGGKERHQSPEDGRDQSR